jgi:hypothetical protein
MFQTVELGVQVVPFLTNLAFSKGPLKHLAAMITNGRENALIIIRVQVEALITTIANGLGKVFVHCLVRLATGDNSQTFQTIICRNEAFLTRGTRVRVKTPIGTQVNV